MTRRMPLPRSVFLAPLMFLTISALASYVAWASLHSGSASLDAEQHDADIAVLCFSPFFFGVGLCLLYTDLTREYCLHLIGDAFSGKVAVSSGRSVSISPLSGLADKLLLIRLRSNLPAGLSQGINLLRVYRRLPPVPYVHYHVQLFGKNGDEEDILITERVLKQKLESLWGARVPLAEEDNWRIEMPVQQRFDSYSLKFQAIHGYNESDVTKGFSPSESPLSFEVNVRLAVALRVRDMRRYKECSLSNARVEVL